MSSSRLADVKEEGFAELDSFLDNNFEELQGFPWHTLDSGSASQIIPGVSDFPVLPYAFEFPQSAPAGPATWAPAVASGTLPQQHRLLKPDGFAFSLPDLTAGPSTQDERPLYSFPTGSAAPASTAQSPKTSGDGVEFLARQQSAEPSVASLEASQSTAEQRNKATLPLSERNKQAQRRHRQRQRERMDTLETQVKRLSEEKHALVAEKAALAGQAAVLTQVLQMRDEQLSQLQQAHQANSSGEPIAIVKSDPEDVEAPRESAVSNGLAESLAEVLTLTVRDDEEIHLQPSQVKAMTPQEVARLWAEYMSALMKQLQAAQGSDAEAAHSAEARISALLQEVLVLLMRYALCDLIKMKQFVAGKVKNPAQSGLENSDMWRSAAHNLQLTDSQRKALVQLRLLFMQKQDILIAQRRAAMAALQSTIPSCASSHDIAAQFLRAEAAMSRLHENLRMENQLIVDLIYTLFVKVSTPVQAARCLVQSFPVYPDSLAIITWVAAEAGDASALELLQRPVRHQSEQSSAGTASN